MINTLFVNYQVEQNAFVNLVSYESPFRILMFRGEGGIGKTRLILECLSEIPPEISYLTINIRDEITNVSDILAQINRRAKLESLQNFNHQITKLQETQKLPPDADLLSHSNSFAFVNEPYSNRYALQLALTDSWFADLQTIKSPFLLIIDSYEHATVDLAEWLTHHVLPRVVETNQMRVLLAGRTVPEPNLEWAAFVKIHQLNGISDARAWLPVAEAIGREVPSLDYLAGACAMVQGNPRLMLQFLKLLPKKAIPTPTEVAQAQLRQIMEAHFNETELRVLCFDLDVDYEDLSTKPHGSKVRGLIEYSKTRSRFSDLVNVCRQLRPKLNWNVQ
ncbi:MAG: hypothetical protein AAF614_17825 [Chloroflexota bacterium]